MSKRLIASVKSDFADVITFLTNRGIIPKPPPSGLLQSAKRIHRATYSLIIWRFRLKRLPDHGQVFIEEIASDALQIMPQILMGYSKTAKLLTRGIIENTLRHIYFSDHPVEFARMNREGKWYISMESLLEYAMIHPIFLDSERKFNAIARLSGLYAQLSAGIHGRRVLDLEMRVALKKIAYNEKVVQKEVDLVEKCTEATNFVIAMFHHEKVRALQMEDRRIILDTMCARARQTWSNCT